MGSCKCGCGTQTKSRFAPGHDAKLKGILQKVVRTGTQVERSYALQTAQQLGWEKHLYGAKNRTYGVELEIIAPVDGYEIERALRTAGIDAGYESYNHTVRDSWKITTDSSVHGTVSGTRGFEIVSPVLYGAAGRKAIKTVCKVLNELGCSVNKTCGLHVHHAAHDLDATAIRNLVANYDAMSAEIDAAMPQSRRRGQNSYCKAIDSTFMARLYTVGTLAEICRNMDRYHVVNLTSYAKYGTVELRQHAGTINADKILNWIEFGQASINAAVRGEAVRNFSDLSPKLGDFYTSRAAQLRAA